MKLTKDHSLVQRKDVTHLKTAIDESNVGAGEVEPPLDLGDGALHVGSCQSLGEAGEGQRHDEQLQNTKGKYLIQYLYEVVKCIFSII